MENGKRLDCEQSLFLSLVDVVNAREARTSGNWEEWKSASTKCVELTDFRSPQFSLAHKIEEGKNEGLLAEKDMSHAQSTRDFNNCDAK